MNFQMKIRKEDQIEDGNFLVKTARPFSATLFLEYIRAATNEKAKVQQDDRHESPTLSPIIDVLIPPLIASFSNERRIGQQVERPSFVGIPIKEELKPEGNDLHLAFEKTTKLKTVRSNELAALICIILRCIGTGTVQHIEEKNEYSSLSNKPLKEKSLTCMCS